MNIFCSPTLSATSWKSNSPQLLIGWLKILHDSSTFFWLHSFSRVGQWTSNSWRVKPKTRHFMSLPESHSEGSLPPKCHWLLWTHLWDVYTVYETSRHMNWGWGFSAPSDRYHPCLLHWSNGPTHHQLGIVLSSAWQYPTHWWRWSHHHPSP